jgi:hypothetical protein
VRYTSVAMRGRSPREVRIGTSELPEKLPSRVGINGVNSATKHGRDVITRVKIT